MVSPMPHRAEWPTIVVCRPDGATLESLCDRLTADGHQALPAPTAAAALRLCQNSQPDLMVLNLTLPDASGLDVLRRIRRSDGVVAKIDPQLPVVMLTDRGKIVDRIRGFDEGADDCLEKPFHYYELRTRIRAILRRRQPFQPTGPTCVGQLVVDPVHRKVMIGEHEVSVTPSEFILLQTLASDPTRVFTKDELTQTIWGRQPEIPRSRRLEAHVGRLRRKLDPDVGTYIVNCPRVGYRLIDA